MKISMMFFAWFASSLMISGLHGQETELKELDTDEDGKVSVAEFETYAGGKLQGFDKLEEFAKAVDSDSNGEISSSEFDGRMQVLQEMAQAMAADGREQKEKGSKGKQNKKSKADKADKGNDKANAKAQDGASKTFQQIQKLVRKNKWEEAAKLMTQKAQDEFVIEQAISAIGLAKMEMDLPIPQLEDSIDEIEDVLVKHGLMDLDIDTSSMFKMEFRMGDDEGEESDGAEEMKEQEHEMDSAGKKILEHINKSGKRWEIVGDLWKAKAGSPLSMSPYSGKIEKQESVGKDQYLFVTMAPSRTDNQEGMVIQMMAPPAVMRMKKVEDQWKLDGRDEKKTKQAMKDFMEKQQDMFGGGDAGREDF